MTQSELAPPVRIGLIGLGALGLPMAVNLRKAGYRLQVHTRSRLAEADPACRERDAATLQPAQPLTWKRY